MVGVKIAILGAIGLVVIGFVALTVFYPLVKTVEGWLGVLKARALGHGVEAPVELGLTMADGGEEAKEQR